MEATRAQSAEPSVVTDFKAIFAEFKESTRDLVNQIAQEALTQIKNQAMQMAKWKAVDVFKQGIGYGPSGVIAAIFFIGILFIVQFVTQKAEMEEEIEQEGPSNRAI